MFASDARSRLTPWFFVAIIAYRYSLHERTALMAELLQIAAGNLLSPIVMFFVLGVAAGYVRSDLTIPEPISKALSLYLMLAIGFKGGVALSASGITSMVVLALTVAIVLSLLMPVIAFSILRVVTSLDTKNAAAIAAHYGSVSIVTFVAATSFLDYRQVHYEGLLVAMLAVMETPAIITGLLLARRSADASSGEQEPIISAQVLRQVFLCGSVVLLAGSFIIGWTTGDKGMQLMAPLVKEPFQAVLAIFLLDMGLMVGRRLSDFGRVGIQLALFGLYMPLIGAAVGMAAAWAIGLSVGGITLVGVLAASASYIVVPAAMRLSLPQANPAIYVTLSLAVTFPFNLVIGIPLYHAVARLIGPA